MNQKTNSTYDCIYLFVLLLTKIEFKYR